MQPTRQSRRQQGLSPLPTTTMQSSIPIQNIMQQSQSASVTITDESLNSASHLYTQPTDNNIISSHNSSIQTIMSQSQQHPTNPGLTIPTFLPRNTQSPASLPNLYQAPQHIQSSASLPNNLQYPIQNNNINQHPAQVAVPHHVSLQQNNPVINPVQ